MKPPQEIKELLTKISEGPWCFCYDGSGSFSIGAPPDPQSAEVASAFTYENAQFIAAAPTIISGLLEQVEEAKKALQFYKDKEIELSNKFPEEWGLCTAASQALERLK